MPIVRRQIQAQLTVGNQTVHDFLAFRASHSLTDAVARATIVAPYAYGTYDSPVEIKCGVAVADGGNGLITRFKGRRRKAHYDLLPRNVVMDCVGELSRADEYINWQESTSIPGRTIPNLTFGNTTYSIGIGGLRVQDLVPSSGHFAGCATYTEIAHAVLLRANVPHTLANLQSTGRVYGFGIADPVGLRFIWHSGTGGLSAGGDVNVENAYRRAGESALSYLQKYSQIEALYDLGPPNRIGFFRLFEMPSGDVVVKLVGGHPSGPYSQDLDGTDIIFTEGGSTEIRDADGNQFPPAPGTPNILSASFQRDYPLGNRTLVMGTELGPFQMHWEAATNIPIFMPIGPPGPTTYHYDPSPPSSDWIDWMSVSGQLSYTQRSVSAKAAAAATADATSITPDSMDRFPDPPFTLFCAETAESMLVTDVAGSSWTVDRGQDGSDAKAINAGFTLNGPPQDIDPTQRFGMDCETVAKARLLEIARETVTGSLTTAQDTLIAPGQIHLVQGPAGLPDRLGTGEPLWCQGNDFELEVRAGAPVLTQTPTYLGGGLELDQNGNPIIPTQMRRSGAPANPA
ncbi:MAG TPA: hypothetical protein VGJ60_07630 [Chloroflexota bacterium]|jgi:hypothetical protein